LRHSKALGRFARAFEQGLINRVSSQRGEIMADLDQRIEAMFQRDRLGACLLVITLWLATLSVLFLAWPYVPDDRVRVVLAIGAAAVLVFNTSSIAAMLIHYKTDKDFIYGLDIRTLDALKARKTGDAS
jgi:hypothetical protein